jgi:nitroreductase
MKTVMEAIKARKSIRAYQDKPLPKAVLNEIMEAAKLAPTAMNAQELEYKVITNKAMISKLSDGILAAMQKSGMGPKGPPAGEKPNLFYKAPLLILIAAPKENQFAVADAALAVENVMLYAAGNGLGSCFIGLAKMIEGDKSLVKALHIADNMTLVAAVICGYPAEDPEPRAKKLVAEYFD